MSERSIPSSFRLMTEPEITEVLAADVPARLATLDAMGYPYITPLWYVYHDGVHHDQRASRQSAVLPWTAT
jgi:nitroimidazol reductase NimA-like FMN-containing flavoprotein (pyridoxamine 5'-phosphate oxidase superfamily)